MTRPRKLKPVALLFDLLIDLALIGLGCLIFYHFIVRPLGPFDLWPMVVQWFGGNKLLAVLILSAVPILAGLASLMRTLARVVTALRPPPPPA